MSLNHYKKLNLKICSINLNGSNPVKLQHLRDKTAFIQAEIICIQETHANTDAKVEEIKKYLGDYEVVTTKTIEATKGIAFLYKKNSYFSNVQIISEIRERAQLIRLEGKNRFFIEFLHIYAPNKISEHRDFVEEISELSWSSKNKIVLGDFNFSAENSNSYASVTKRKIWQKFFLASETQEIGNSDLRSTWISGLNESRIDRIYASQTLIEKFNYNHDHRQFLFSDHQLITGQLEGDFSKKKINKKIWKLNESILDYSFIEDNLKKILEKIKYVENDPTKIYEFFMRDARAMLQHESRIVNIARKLEKKALIEKNKRELATDESELLKENLSNIYEEERKGIQIRANEDRKLFIYQPKQALIIKEKSRQQNNLISKFLDNDNNILTDDILIRENLYQEYNNLMGNSRGDQEKIINYDFQMNTLEEGPKKLLLEKDFVFEEFYEIIKKMTNSSPGPNGLTITFFKKYFHCFGVEFTKMVNANLKNGKLPSTMKETLIKLIPKNKDKIKSMKTLRPISLTNIDYRIMAKAIYNRMATVMSDLVGRWQKCSIPGRKIDSILIQIRDIIEDANRSKEKKNFLSLLLISGKLSTLLVTNTS